MKNNIILLKNCKRERYKGGDIVCTILEKIKDKTALELLQEYNIKLTPPIDISLLLERIGISVIAKDFSGIEMQNNYPSGYILGAAISRDNNLAIFYRKSDTYNRKIFTIAHELGHCCKHTDDLKISHIELRTSRNHLNDREIDVNVFAGELLIPEIVLMPIYKEFIIPSLSVLSNIFQVSTNVMAARLDYLGLNYYKDTEISEE